MSMTPQERMALGVVAVLLAAGAGARSLRPAPEPATWSAAPDSAAGARLRAATSDSVSRAEHRSRPLADGERLDPNTATADDLQRLPRVGPSLAERMVAWRAAHGRFRTLADVDSIPGVGPALLAGIAPHLAVAPAPAGPIRPLGVVAARTAQPAETGAVVELNTATAAELDALPGIGPAIAARVVEYRVRHGRFRSMEELEKVPGIGPSLRSRLGGRVRVTP